MKRIFTHLTTAVLLSLVLLFVTACGGDTKPAAADATDNTPAITAPAQSDTDTTEMTAAEEDTTNTLPERTAEETEEVEPIETKEPTKVISGGDLADRTVDQERLGVIIDLIAQDLETQKLAYVSSLGQDCSGIYHKIKDQVQRKMKVLGDQSKYQYPIYDRDRNSRQIADWYYRNGNLHIVQDAMAERNLIRPGCVMFYGRTEERYSNLTIDLLTNPGKFIHDGTNGKIYHVGVVTKVERDEDGNVVKYTLMHGRNSKYTASRTSGNWDGPGGYGTAFAKFPFGNWNQQWVAVAHIETPMN